RLRYPSTTSRLYHMFRSPGMTTSWRKITICKIFHDKLPNKKSRQPIPVIISSQRSGFYDKETVSRYFRVILFELTSQLMSVAQFITTTQFLSSLSSLSDIQLFQQ